MANRAPYYRIVFTMAALYNLGFGLWAGFSPGSFFGLFDLRQPLYPAIWSCLGMVVGTYGLGYGYAALRLERAAPFIAIGLVGKILGPIGWLVTVRSGDWPARTFPLVLFNDIVWWLPFSLFLIDGTRLGERVRSSAAWACGAVNALAAAGVILTLQTRGLPGWLRAWTWSTWTAGFFLTAFSLADCTPGIVVSTALLMTLFCP